MAAKAATHEGWVSARPEGATHRYRATPEAAGGTAAQLWQLVKPEVAQTPAAHQDAEGRHGQCPRRRSEGGDRAGQR